MSITIQNLPTEIHSLIFENFEINDLMNAMKVCKTWKKIIEANNFLSDIHSDTNTSIENLIIDIPRDLVIDKSLSIAGPLLIRARNIYSKNEICLSGTKVTFVSNQVRYLGSIKAKKFDRYTNGSNFVKGPMPGGSSYFLRPLLNKPNFWPSLVKKHLDSASQERKITS